MVDLKPDVIDDMIEKCKNIFNSDISGISFDLKKLKTVMADFSQDITSSSDVCLTGNVEKEGKKLDDMKAMLKSYTDFLEDARDSLIESSNMLGNMIDHIL